MKRFIVALLFCGASVCAFAGTGAAQSVQFTGLLRTGNAVPVRFSVDVPATQHATLSLSNGYKLEFFTAGSQGHAKTTQVRLLSATGKVLHTATYPAAGASKSLDYLVCQGKVTYISPAPTKLPSCSRQ